MKKFLFCVFALVCCFAASLSASTITGCSSCDGASYTLDYNIVSTSSTFDVFNVFLLVDDTTYTGGGQYLNAVAVKPDSSILAVNLLSAPSTLPIGSSWVTSLGGLNANACDGSGSGFFCTGSTGLGAPVSTLGKEFEWQVSVTHDTWFTGASLASIKAIYVDASGNKIGSLLSADIGDTMHSPVPEPLTSSLVGLGLIGLFFVRRKISSVAH